MNTTRLAAVLLAAVPFASLCAQQGNDERSQAELTHVQRQLQQNRKQVEDLTDMRFRHDTGLPAEHDATPGPVVPVTTETRERLLQEWRDQDAATASLVERFNKAKAMVESLRTEAAERARTAPREERFIVVPQAGTAQQSQQSRTPVEAIDHAPGSGADPRRAPTATALPNIVTELGPIRGQIHGSKDHLRVAQSLFKAGQSLLDRGTEARAQNQIGSADALDARGKECLLRAIEELKPLLAEKEPAFPAMFYLGRCRELLFRCAEQHDGLSLVTAAKDYQKREQEVREPFLTISARDVAKKGQRGEVEVLGPWGMAAQAAVEHFRWMNLYGGYKPRTPIESLTWPGEKDQ